MKRPLILHIGMSKTGSSSIQHVLAEQRPALSAQGVYLARSPGWANHALLPASVVNDPKILWGYHPGTWEGLSPEVRIARFRDEFAAEMSALPDDVARVIITAEQLGMVLREPDEVARLAALLGAYFAPVQVVVYIRRQDQHAASAYGEWLRSGTLREPGLPAGGPEKHPEYDYGGLLDCWADAFGAAAIVPRIFARDRLLDGDVVADFLALAGIALPPLPPELRPEQPQPQRAGPAADARSGPPHGVARRRHDLARHAGLAPSGDLRVRSAARARLAADARGSVGVSRPLRRHQRTGPRAFLSAAGDIVRDERGGSAGGGGAGIA